MPFETMATHPPDCIYHRHPRCHWRKIERLIAILDTREAVGTIP